MRFTRPGAEATTMGRLLKPVAKSEVARRAAEVRFTSRI
jgi:hypothetical protein